MGKARHHTKSSHNKENILGTEPWGQKYPNKSLNHKLVDATLGKWYSVDCVVFALADLALLFVEIPFFLRHFRGGGARSSGYRDSRQALRKRREPS